MTKKAIKTQGETNQTRKIRVEVEAILTIPEDWEPIEDENGYTLGLQMDNKICRFTFGAIVADPKNASAFSRDINIEKKLDECLYEEREELEVLNTGSKYSLLDDVAEIKSVQDYIQSVVYSIPEGSLSRVQHERFENWFEYAKASCRMLDGSGKFPFDDSFWD